MLKRKNALIQKVVPMMLAFSLISCGIPADASVEENVDEKVLRITNSVLDDENGEMFEDYSMDDIIFVLNTDSKAGASILKHLDEVSIPAYAPEGKAFESSTVASNSERPDHYSVSKDLITGRVDVCYDDFDNLETDLQTEYEPGMFESSNPSGPVFRATSWNEYDPQNNNDTRTTYKLFIKKGNSSYYGSGFQISPNYLGTAGHCVYLRKENGTAIGWADEILCVPSWRAAEPYQPYGNAYGTNLEAGGNWVANGTTDFDSADDWGTIKLNKTMSIGYLGKRNVNDNSKLNGKTLCGIGYPNAGSPMKVTLTSVQSIGTRLVEVDFAFIGGMSGGPVLDEDDYIVGIIRGTHTSDGITNGTFVKFDNWIYNKMTSYS